jgi:hypothetical protein
LCGGDLEMIRNAKDIVYLKDVEDDVTLQMAAVVATTCL